MMLLNAEELLALVNGDAEPDRLADLLDRLEHCPESADALQILVSLRANREEALEALHQAAEREATAPPIPLPAARPTAPPMSWAAQGLRMAATVAIVAVISVWASNTILSPQEVAEQAVDTVSLATAEYDNLVGPGGPVDVELTGDSEDTIIFEAYRELEEGNYAVVRELLEGLPADAEGRVPLYRGMSHYFLHEYELALEDFIEVRTLEIGRESGLLHQAAWYEANSLLALDQPMQAVDVLEAVKSAPEGYRFKEPASDSYLALRAALGLTSPKQD